MQNAAERTRLQWNISRVQTRSIYVERVWMRWVRTHPDARNVSLETRLDTNRSRLNANSRNASGCVQKEILINLKIYINPTQIRTELPSTLSLDGLGLPWQMDWILPKVMSIRIERVNQQSDVVHISHWAILARNLIFLNGRYIWLRIFSLNFSMWTTEWLIWYFL